MIFVTAQGQADAEKARRECEQPGCSLEEAEAAAAAHEALEGHVVAQDDPGRGAREGREVTEGPGPDDVLEPGLHRPHDFRRGPLTEGHAGVSPGHEAPNRQVPVMPPGTAVAAGGPAAVPHVDLSGSSARALTPDAAAFASALSRPARRG